MTSSRVCLHCAPGVWKGELQRLDLHFGWIKMIIVADESLDGNQDSVAAKG